jgi:DNA replication protein DnaC
MNEGRAVPAEILLRARIPRRFWKAALQELQGTPAHQRLLDYFLNLDSKFSVGMGLLLHGPFGCGKTAAACMALIEVLTRSSNRVFFVQAAQLDWLARHRSEVDASGVPAWTLLVEAPFVVIDDVGAERNVDWNHAWFEEVVRARYNEMLPTILTTNKTLPDLFKVNGWLEGIVRDCFDEVHMTRAFR